MNLSVNLPTTLLLILSGSLAFSPGIVAAKGAHNDSFRQVCPLPKLLINIETPHGKSKNLCVSSQAAKRMQKSERATQPPLPPSLGTTPTAASLATDLMTAAIKGAGSKAAGAGMGWVLGGLGLSSGVSQTNAILEEISGELQDIENTLIEMNAEIADIDAAIRIQNCDNFIDSTLGARTLIDTLTADYQDFVATASSGFVPPLTDCPIQGTESCVDDWVAAVLDDSAQNRGITNALLQIHNSMVAISANDGIIVSCLNRTILPLPKEAEDDVNYYASVNNLMNVFYNYQARGLLLLVEAYHFEAWKAAGELGGDPVADPTVTSDLCLTPPNNAVKLECIKVQSSVATVHSHLVQQFTKAGVGYTDEDTRIHYRPSSLTSLFARSLEDFTAVAHLQGRGESCSSPLSSSAPCGITAGNHTTAGLAFDITFANQFNWRPAHSGEFGLLFLNNGSRTPASYLRDAGFENPEDKLITFANTFPFEIVYDFINFIETTAICFADLDVPASFSAQPVCVTDNLDNFMYSDQWGITENSNIPTLGKRNGFYNFLINDQSVSQGQLFATGQVPGWNKDQQATPSAQQQYHWPMLVMETDILCTKGRSKHNVVGAYTRCGQDLDIWLEHNVPGPAISPDSQPISYDYFGQQPRSDLRKEWEDDAREKLLDGIVPAINAGINEDVWVAFADADIDAGDDGTPQPSVVFDLHDTTYLSLVSISYANVGDFRGPARVEIFVSTDGGDTYPSVPNVVYKGFRRSSSIPGVISFTDVIPVNVEGATNVRMDFYQGNVGHGSSPNSSAFVLLGEIKFIE